MCVCVCQDDGRVPWMWASFVGPVPPDLRTLMHSPLYKDVAQWLEEAAG